MKNELTEEQRTEVLDAAHAGIRELLAGDPLLSIRVDADDLTAVYMAGVVAGVDATARVFDLITKGAVV